MRAAEGIGPVGEEHVYTVKASALKGRPVVSLAGAEPLGAVSDILVDAAISRIVGLKIQAKRRGKGHVVRARDIRCLGADAVVIPDRRVLQDGAAPDLQAFPTGHDLHHTKVVTYSGTLLGRLRDVEFDVEQFHITRYLLAGTLWDQLAHPVRTFRPAPGFLSGVDLLLVPDEIANVLA
jgi:uncharacterized protein YrrD